MLERIPCPLPLHEQILYKMQGIPTKKDLLMVVYASRARDFNQEIDRIIEVLNADTYFGSVRFQTRYTGGIGAIVFWVEDSEKQQEIIASIKARVL
jgi:hypothetical protein